MLLNCNLKCIHHTANTITDGETEARFRKDDGDQDTRGQRRGNSSHDLKMYERVFQMGNNK